MYSAKQKNNLQQPLSAMKKIMLCAALITGLYTQAQEYTGFPMWNPQLPMEKRVEDVISRLSLEEKVGQMLNATPAVPHLGILAYDWWSEVLHGVARTPYRTTVFPQAIGMAATWDTNALFKMADYSALEGRAIYNKALETGRNKDRYVGLTYWTPNINIFRDPRWGRGQETYGEDPFLTAMLGRAFVRGLQGDDPKYLKAAACAKHFAVHSGPEPSRHSDNFNPSTYDLWDTYLPAFKELITKANVAGVMCAYNALNTQPCCGNDLLMNDILRKQWKFTGYVTSDCWAIDDFFRFHKTHKDATTSAIDAVMHGTDIECGNSVYRTLIDAVKSGLLSEAQINISLRRLFTIRFRLGMFDPPSMVPYAQTPSSVLESPAHQAHALEMARASMVLLRNEHQTLPLKKNLQKIVVLGPNADNHIAVLGNYNGTPSKITTVLEGIREKLGKGTEIVYEKAINFTNDTLLQFEDFKERFTYQGKTGIYAEYFGNENLEGKPILTQIESDLDHYWSEGHPPVNGLPSTHYAARYTTEIIGQQDETLHFEIEGDDGYRVLIDDSIKVDAWTKNRWGAKQFKLKTKLGQHYKVVVEYYQTEGNASIRLNAGRFEKTDVNALLQRVKDADAIVYVGGISPQLEGEEMKVTVPGFFGGDRTSIQLPEVQTDLLKALHQSGKPIVFVMMTGSAIATPWESEHIPAIINAWYGGQAAGTAVADILFGDYNPAGRLPVTFYKNDADLPDFSNYEMKGRTYRYFTGKPLYAFGYGLSYTHFRYTDLKIPTQAKKGQSMKVSVSVENNGKTAGDEVVQLYVKHLKNSDKAAQLALKGFRRIHLKAGEHKRIEFLLSPEDLSLVNANTGVSFQPKGTVMISIGGGQPGMTAQSTETKQALCNIQ